MKNTVKLLRSFYYSVIICLLISCSASFAGPIQDQVDEAIEGEFIYPRTISTFVGFDFTGYIFPLNGDGLPYNQVTIIKKLAFQDSQVIFDVVPGSALHTEISNAPDPTMLNITIGIVDSMGGEHSEDAHIVINNNARDDYTIYSDVFSTTADEGLGKIVVAIDGTGYGKDDVFISRTIADRDGISPTLQPSFDQFVPIYNRAKGSGKLYITGQKHTGKILTDGIGTVLAKSGSGLMRGTLFPSLSMRGSAMKVYNYNQVSQQGNKLKDKNISGSAAIAITTLWGQFVFEFEIPACTGLCGSSS